MTAPLHVAVVGAGAFGGWIALALLRRGHRVTLLDAWGAGHSRSSSGGETRVIRGLYGADRRYLDWTVRSFEQWREAEAWSGLALYQELGCLWMFRDDDGYARISRPHLAAVGLELDELSPAAAARRWPAVDFSGVSAVWFEPRAGYLRARLATQAVAREVAARGGHLRRAAVRPIEIPGAGELGELILGDGEVLRADRFVLAAGPWLPELLPELLGRLVRPTRQEVFFFGLPEGSSALHESELPVWIDWGERIFYGIPGNDERGFKLGDDTRGALIDPTSADRRITESDLTRARALLAERFPSLADAPLVESRVCQYENTPDGHLIVDRHPAAGNLWIAGGGSGHGFKLAPALGEEVAEALLADRPPGGELALAGRPPFSDQGPTSQFKTGSRHTSVTAHEARFGRESSP
jgi:glycine/D-amino acid oxidase-like deaminating enzyme